MVYKQIADRQGDVTLVHTDMDPDMVLAGQARFKVAPIKGRIVLAEGEVTGHAHTMPPKGVTFLKPNNLPTGHSLLVVTETTVERGSLLEGEVIGTMPGGTIRFKCTDGTVMRFARTDVEVKPGVGVKVKRAYTPLTHDEHDGIPVGVGVYTVMQHQTADARAVRRLVAD